MKSYKSVRIKSFVTTLILATVLLVSLRTVAIGANSDGSHNFTLTTHAYYEEDEDVSQFETKTTTSPVKVIVSRYTYPMDVWVVGATYGGNVTSYSDCSNGHVYRISGTGQTNMTNYVKEWKYSYAGLKGSAVVDSYTVLGGTFDTDI